MGKPLSTLARLTAALLLLSTLVAPNQPAEAASTCTKANAVKVESGTKFVCKKVNGKLQWVKQGSNAVVNNQPSSPSTTTVKEWSKCSRAGSVSGSGDNVLSCVKVAGKLQWVKNTTLDNPVPKRPCRTEGQIGNWQGEVVLCTASNSGKTWQIPTFEDKSRQYLLSSPSCHSIYARAAIESFEAGNWMFVDYADIVQGAGCASGLGKLVKSVMLAEGSLIRLRVYTSRWSVATLPVTASDAQNISLNSYERTLVTPASSRVTITDLSGNVNAQLEFARYEEEGLESVFTFRVASGSFFNFRGVTNFRTSRGIAQISSQPPTCCINFVAGSTFEIRVRRDAIQFDLNEFEFDLTGVQNVTSFAKKVKVNFTWW